MGRHAGALRARRPQSTTASTDAEGGRLGSPDGRDHKGLRWRRPHDRHLRRTRPPAGRDGRKGGVDRCLGHSRGGFTTKIHALVDAQGRPLLIKLTAGQASDIAIAKDLIGHLPPGSMLLADEGYSANELRTPSQTEKRGQTSRSSANEKT